MREADVIEVLDALDSVGVEWWILGGWGVDALIGEQTRAHKDLDLAVFLTDLPCHRAAVLAISATRRR